MDNYGVYELNLQVIVMKILVIICQYWCNIKNIIWKSRFFFYFWQIYMWALSQIVTYSMICSKPYCSTRQSAVVCVWSSKFNSLSFHSFMVLNWFVKARITFFLFVISQDRCATITFWFPFDWNVKLSWLWTPLSDIYSCPSGDN